MRARSADLDWLLRRPIAHRGLHGLAQGVVENSLGAAEAAINGGYAIECDVQATADGDAVVFHDFTLDRLTAATGDVSAFPRDALGALRLGASLDLIPALDTFLGRVAARVPVICEVKSRFDGDARLADRVQHVVARYEGPLAIKSFDPAVIARLRGRRCPRPLGIVSEAGFVGPEWHDLSRERRHAMAHLLHYAETLPDFLSFNAGDLPHAVPYLCRTGLGLPVIAWTVRTSDQRRRAAPWSDQIVFEGFMA